MVHGDEGCSYCTHGFLELGILVGCGRLEPNNRVFLPFLVSVSNVFAAVWFGDGFGWYRWLLLQREKKICVCGFSNETKPFFPWFVMNIKILG